MQLPAYSPVLPWELVRASFAAARAPEDIRERLERHLATRFAADHVVLTGSGTQALQLAIERCRRAERDDLVVALPAYSCFDLVTAAIGAGARIRFYDVDPVTLTPDISSFRAALVAGVDAAVAGNLFGFPLDWDRLRHECHTLKTPLIEDAAQGLGSAWRGLESGSFGDLTVLSFGRGKGWMGGGGGALLQRRGLPGSCRLERASGASAARALAVSYASWALGRPGIYRLPTLLPGLRLGETVYRSPGLVTSMSPVSAGIALRHSQVAMETADVRRTWASQWQTLAQAEEWELRGISVPAPVINGTGGYLRTPVLASNEKQRDEIVLRARHAGAAAGYPVALTELREAANSIAGAVETPGAQMLARRLLTLPTHPRVTTRDLAMVRRSMDDILAS